MKKRILLFGGDGYDNVSLNMERAFREIGHDAERFYYIPQLADRASLMYKVLWRTPFQSRAIKMYDSYRNKLGEHYLAKIKEYKPDLIFIVHFGSIAGEQIRYITEQLGIPVAWWVMADEALVSRFSPFNVDTYTYCTHLMIADTSWISTFRLLGNAKISYLPFAADPYWYKPINLPHKFEMSIVAAFGAEVPTVVHKGLILSKLAKSNIPVRVIANGIAKYFSRYTELKKLDFVEATYLAPQVNELYNQSKIALTLNNPQAKSDPHVRAIEAAAARAFQLSEYRENTENLLGDTVVQFSSLDELVELAKFYLLHESERKKLASASYEKVMREHTTLNRARTVIEEVFT